MDKVTHVYLTSKPCVRDDNGRLIITSDTRFNYRGEADGDFESYQRLVATRQGLFAVEVDDYVGARDVPPTILGVAMVDSPAA